MIQELESGLFVPLYLDDIFSVFHTRKPLEEDLEDGVVVLVTPKGITWNPYNETFADNEALMTNAKRDLLPSEYICHELMVDDDHPKIDLVLAMDNHLIDSTLMG